MTEYSAPAIRGVLHPVERRLEGRAALNLETGHYVVLGTLAAIITVRFFTEELHAIPRAANFIDVPLLPVIVAAAAAHRVRSGRAVHQSAIFVLSALFLALATVSTFVNFSRVDLFPDLAYVYGFLGPAAFYLATFALWEPGRVFAISRMLVGLAFIQFMAILTVDVPEFLKSRNPDVVSGTFGTNAYQLIFFLLLFVALIAGIVTFEPRSRVRFLALPFIGAAYLAIFLAQYRSLLITTALATLFIGWLIARRGRGFFIGAAAVAGLVLTLLFVVVYVPTNKFTEAFTALRTDPSYFVDSRIGPAKDVYNLYGDDWHFAVIGTGPGTYSSRAWATFAQLNSTSGSDVAGPYARKLLGGRAYHTDVSDRYVVPRLEAPAKFGTHNFSNPYSSYLALLAEGGILAFVLLVGMYALGLVRSVGAARYLARYADPGDPLPAVVLATATAFFVIIQMGVFGNWFETARVTLPTWILFAVVTRELTARRPFAEFPH